MIVFSSIMTSGVVAVAVLSRQHYLDLVAAAPESEAEPVGREILPAILSVQRLDVVLFLFLQVGGITSFQAPALRPFLFLPPGFHDRVAAQVVFHVDAARVQICNRSER